jgi:hypothetical protein
MTGCKLQISSRIQEDINRGGYGATAAMAEHSNDLDTAAQMFNGIFQTAENFASETISSDPNDE